MATLAAEFRVVAQRVEPDVRRALLGAVGAQRVDDATSEAMAYAFEHFERNRGWVRCPARRVSAHAGLSNQQIFELLGALPPDDVGVSSIAAGQLWWWEPNECGDTSFWTLEGEVCNL